MSFPIEKINTIVYRITKSNGDFCGTAFLINSTGNLLTCAHLFKNITTDELISKSEIENNHLIDGKNFSLEKVGNYKQGEDYAIIHCPELSGIKEIPSVNILKEIPVSGVEVRCFGFGDKTNTVPTSVEGKISNYADGYYQFNAFSSQREVLGGDSGSPVFCIDNHSPAKNAIIGWLIAKADSPRTSNTKEAYTGVFLLFKKILGFGKYIEMGILYRRKEILEKIIELEEQNRNNDGRASKIDYQKINVTEIDDSGNIVLQDTNQSSITIRSNDMKSLRELVQSLSDKKAFELKKLFGAHNKSVLDEIRKIQIEIDKQNIKQKIKLVNEDLDDFYSELNQIKLHSIKDRFITNYKLLREYEELFILEGDPMRKIGNKRDIKQIKERIKDAENELKTIANKK